MDQQPIRRLVNRVCRVLPTPWLVGSAASSFAPLAKLGRAGLQHRTVPIEHGPAAGMSIDVGWSDTSMCLGTYELAVQHWLADRIGAEDQPVVFDIGAHVGFFSLVAARACHPDGQVVAFEPDVANAGLIRSNLAANGVTNVEVVEAAVGAVPGVAHLRRSEQTARHHLAEPGAIDTQMASITVVQLVSIDALVADGLFPAPSIVKLDVEGHEVPALLGMIETLRSARPALLIELDGSDEADVDRRLGEALTVLQPLGYGWARLADSYPHLDSPVAHFAFDPG